MSYKIRLMRREDVDQVVEIDKEAFPTQWPPTNYRNELQNKLAHYIIVYQEGNTDNTKSSPTSRFSSILKWLSGNRTLHEAVNEEYIVGFAGCWFMADENHITEIAVRESYRRQGIGLLMLINLIEMGIDFNTILATLEVRVSNISAQKLYEKLGFEVVGSRKRYYTDNHEDALIMTNNNIKSPDFQMTLNRFKMNLMQRWGISYFPVIDTEANRRY
ncbi:MAG: ribosomal protein S18-alanine N-acetyltransferase [Dehalococcoidales bacterium]|nr:ribosomal protein S18-alanine N-acetyltransferase [Dehalococcoidales bacterium]